MKILDYLKPDNLYAQWIVYLLIAIFVCWLVLLIWNIASHIWYSRQIKRSEDAGRWLVPNITSHEPERSDALHSQQEGDKVFSAFLERKRIKDSSPIARHIRAIFDAGWNESQLDVRALIKNTSDRLFSTNRLLRSLLSTFIVLGLLGTLFGLADTMAALDELLRSSKQLDNETLGKGLQQMLATLKGAFAPSIWGVSSTVVGVLLFAFYSRMFALPLGSRLERITLTLWVPGLVPTASQKLLDKLQLSERQMQRSFEAAQQVAEFAENIQNKSGAFSETLGLTTETLKQMAQTADRLGIFSENFVEGVRAMMPFQQDLRALYQQMVNESRAFQESVQRNIAGAEDFQRHIQEQLNSQHQQLAQLLVALQSYEAAYIANREQIDEKLGLVLDQAHKAFQHLSQRNEEIGRVLDETLGKPLRTDLTKSLSEVETTLQSQLGQVENSLRVQLSALSERLRQLDVPLNAAAQNFTDTFHNFNEYTDEWRSKLQREFALQNETNQKQLQRIESLSEQLPQLLRQLSDSSSNFSETSGRFADRGQQLSQDVTLLSQNIVTLGQSISTLSEKITPQENGDGRIAELLAQQANILQELTKRIERLASTQPQRQQTFASKTDGGTSASAGFRPGPRWRSRLKSWITFGRR